MFEHFTGELRRGANSGMGKAVFSWVRLQKGNQFRDVVRGDRWMNNQYIGRDRRQCDRRKILEWIVRNFRVKAGIDDVARPDNRNGISIGRRSRSGTHPKIASGPWLILDIELLTKAA